MLYLLFNHHFYIYIKVSAMEQPLGAQKNGKQHRNLLCKSRDPFHLICLHWKEPHVDMQ